MPSPVKDQAGSAAQSKESVDSVETLSDSVDAWQAFLETYTSGEFPVGEPEPPGPREQLESLQSSHDSSDEDCVFEFGNESPFKEDDFLKDSAATAKKLRKFYEKHNFLPPPPSKLAYEQRRLLSQYRLDGEIQREAFDHCTSLLSSIFEGRCAFVSIFKDGRQIIPSAKGRKAQDILDLDMGNECAICSHTVLRQDHRRMEVQDVSKDWRFRGNPWFQQHWIKSYVGQPIFLASDPTAAAESSAATKTREAVVIGVLAVVDEKPMTLTKYQVKLLQDVAAMVSREVQGNFDQIRRDRETAMRESVSSFLNDTLVLPSITRVPAEHTSTPALSTIKRASHSAARTEKDFANQALDMISKLLDAESAVILDISEVVLWDAPSVNTTNSSSTSAKTSRISIVSHLTCERMRIEVDEIVNSAIPRIQNFLQSYAANQNTRYNLAQNIRSGFEDIFSPQTTAHLAYPFFTSGRPHLLMIAATTSVSFTYTPTDAIFLSNIGCILLACFVRVKLEKADAAKTAFVSQVSHELRTPLHGLLSHVELLRDVVKHNDLESAEGLLNTAEHCGHALRDILENVLESSKMMNAKPADQLESLGELVEVDLQELILQTTRMCCMRDDLAFSVDYENGGDQKTNGVMVYVEIEDRPEGQWNAWTHGASLRRVLVNLITNALKYTREGSIHVRAEQRSRSEELTDIAISVTDTGCGIEPEFIDQMFEPFVQKSNFSSGAGLGAFIAQSIVHRMRGDKIDVQSTVGQGSTFSIVLPMKMSDERKNMDQKPQMIKTTIKDTKGLVTPRTPRLVQRKSSYREQPDHSRKLRVLIVDDNPIGRRILTSMIKKLPIEYVEAVDGVDALERFKEFQPDATWTDVSMPRMNGCEFASAAREVEKARGWQASRIVAITGLGSSDSLTKETALHMGHVNRWLVKGNVKLKELVDDLFDNVSVDE